MFACSIERGCRRLDTGHVVTQLRKRCRRNAAAAPYLKEGAWTRGCELKLLPPDAIKVGNARRIEELERGKLARSVFCVPRRRMSWVGVQIVVDIRRTLGQWL